MAFNVFTAGTPAASAEVNENFTETRHLTTRAFTNTRVLNSSTAWSDVLTLSTPAATKSLQTVFIDATIEAFCAAGPDTMEVRLYDNTAAVAIVTESFGTNNTRQISRFLQGTVTLATVGATKSIKLQIRRSAGTGGDVEAFGGRVVCQLVES